jgi:hypothetical protein
MLFEGADDRILRGIELPVRADKPEPCQALGHQDDPRQDQQRRGRVRTSGPEGGDSKKTAELNVRKKVLARPGRALTRSAIST